jgi:hypothetical protein
MTVMDAPIVVFGFSLVTLLVSEQAGAYVQRRFLIAEEEERDDLKLIVAATLTLLGLVIGFTFSMAVSRYDQRKNYEEAEANAIGTEFSRADLLPATDRERVRVLLRRYLDQRVLFYTTNEANQLRHIRASTEGLQSELWSVVRDVAAAQPSPVVALAVSGMNDVLNSEGYTQAAWWNRIPLAAWVLMGTIALCCNLLVGYSLRRAEAERTLLFVLPFIVSISFFLIAEIDSPVGGTIHVSPQNLIAVSQSLHRH